MFAFTCIFHIKNQSILINIKPNRNEKNRSNINKSSPELK